MEEYEKWGLIVNIQKKVSIRWNGGRKSGNGK
jgi:hypothetical protein